MSSSTDCGGRRRSTLESRDVTPPSGLADPNLAVDTRTSRYGTPTAMARNATVDTAKRPADRSFRWFTVGSLLLGSTPERGEPTRAEAEIIHGARSDRTVPRPVTVLPASVIDTDTVTRSSSTVIDVIVPETS